MIDRAIQMLKEQQSKVKERSAQWMVASQLMDICRREPASAEIIAQDLENESMSIVEAEKKIKAFADKHKQYRHKLPQKVREFCDRWEREVLQPWFVAQRTPKEKQGACKKKERTAA